MLWFLPSSGQGHYLPDFTCYHSIAWVITQPTAIISSQQQQRFKTRNKSLTQCEDESLSAVSSPEALTMGMCLPSLSFVEPLNSFGVSTGECVGSSRSLAYLARRVCVTAVWRERETGVGRLCGDWRLNKVPKSPGHQLRLDKQHHKEQTY